jgi:hypothetical protein
MADRVSSAMGASKKKSKSKKSKGTKRHVHEMNIRHAANGGYIVKHSFKPSANDADVPEPEEHAIGDMDQLQDHVGDNMMPQASPQPGPSQAPPQGVAV